MNNGKMIQCNTTNIMTEKQKGFWLAYNSQLPS